MSVEAATGRRPVVVGADGSDSALEAVRWAAVEARRRDTGLRVVTAFGWAPEHRTGRTERYRRELLERTRSHVLAGATTVAERTVDGLPVSAELVVGSAAGVLAEQSRDAQLLVLGSRGLGGLGGLLVGSVAVALAAGASCPVVVVRGEDRDPSSPEPVVVGVDGTPTDESAVAFAFAAAAARRVPLLAVHAFGDLLLDPQVAALVDWEALAEDAGAVLADRLRPWTEKFPDLDVRQVVAHGSAARVLVEKSEEAQLVVMGSRGRGTLAGLVLGSVGHAVLHRSHCPVAVVRPDAAPGRAPAES
ncbi:universal stress protein [Pseudonocardia lacus]|uniref:universal stress protein n=1 Tax=Pseudonocardia lacus TaxID=2835865 RepID=UPI0020288019|nr:universal stress protein [Pseudonocardia lacus]